MRDVHISTRGDRTAMWANDVAFCPEGIGELTPTVVSQLLSSQILSANFEFVELLRERYKNMVKNFTNVSHCDDSWNQDINGKTCKTVACHCKPDARLAVPTQCIGSSDNRITCLCGEPNFGMDLPVWFYRRGMGENMPRVMVVAQDPLRIDPRIRYLYISSPWAFHSQDFREKEKNSIPSLLVDCLIAQGFCLYLTDAAKLFARDHNYAIEHIQPVFQQAFQKVLRREIELFKPVVIVAIGEPASRMVLTLGGKSEIGVWTHSVIPRPKCTTIKIGDRNIQCISAFHFSRIASHREQLKSEYGFDNIGGNEKYVSYYVESIRSALKERNLTTM